jgi:glycosyltransferase involved in cell wall biosynthesis
MKIAMVAPCWYAVPPTGYGGIETVVHLLVEELVARGDAVTLYSTGDSRTSAELRALYRDEQDTILGGPDQVIVESAHALFAYRDIVQRDFDVVHDHSGFVGASLGGLLDGPPVLHTVHGPATRVNRPLYEQLARSPRLFFSAISHYQRARFDWLPVLGTVHNATDPALHPLVTTKENYLVEVSRICADKGQHLAIALAQRAGLPLKLAGKIENNADGRRYFAEAIEPQLGDGIEYVGDLELAEKVALIGKARAFIFPVTWPEPFGLVVTEALACGTPVIASPEGAVPEIVRDGVEGFLATDLDGMLRALDRLGTIDPVKCRQRVVEAFSPAVMATGYQTLYAQMIERSRSRGNRLQTAELSRKL